MCSVQKMCSVDQAAGKQEKEADMDGIEELKKSVERLRKNRENVPLETLKTKYKKGYTELLETIRDQATEILNRETMNGIRIRKVDKDVLDRIQQTVDKEQFAKQAGKSLFKEYSVEKFMEIVENARAAALAVWIPYWQGFCGERSMPTLTKSAGL